MKFKNMTRGVRKITKCKHIEYIEYVFPFSQMFDIIHEYDGFYDKNILISIWTLGFLSVSVNRDVLGSIWFPTRIWIFEKMLGFI